MTKKITVFNFVYHELQASVLPSADEYSIIDCREVDYDFSNMLSYHAFIKEIIEKMVKTQIWSPTDQVCIIFPQNEKALFAVMLLQCALSGMDIQPILWMETSEIRGMYISMGDIFMIGLDTIMSWWHKNNEKFPSKQFVPDPTVALMDIKFPKKG